MPRRRLQGPFPVAVPTTNYRSSSTHPLPVEQANPIEELQRHDHTVRGQRHIENSGPALVDASSSRAPEAHRGQNRLNRPFEDPQGHGSPNNYFIQPVITQ